MDIYLQSGEDMIIQIFILSYKKLLYALNGKE